MACSDRHGQACYLHSDEQKRDSYIQMASNCILPQIQLSDGNGNIKCLPPPVVGSRGSGVGVLRARISCTYSFFVAVIFIQSSIHFKRKRLFELFFLKSGKKVLCMCQMHPDGLSDILFNHVGPSALMRIGIIVVVFLISYVSHKMFK